MQLETSYPHKFMRYMHLGRLCADSKAKDKGLKTQLRFSDKDIEILLKEKGSGKPYRIVKMEDFTDVTLVLEYDHNKKWAVRTDKPPRRLAGPTRRKELPPHMIVSAGKDLTGHSGQKMTMTPSSRNEQQTHEMSRESSTDSNDSLPSKKLRKGSEQMDEQPLFSQQMDIQNESI